MSSAATNSADNVSCEITLLRAIVFAMANASTVLANLVFVVAKSAVKRGQLPELVAFMVILTFGGRCCLLIVSKGSSDRKYITYSFYHFVDHLDASGYLLFRVGDNKTMKIFLCVFSVLIWPRFSFLYATLTADADFSTAVPFHLLQTVPSGAHKETKEVDFRKFFHRDVNLVRRALRSFLLMVFNGRTEVRIIFECSVDEFNAFVFQFFSVAHLAGVGPATM